MWGTTNLDEPCVVIPRITGNVRPRSQNRGPGAPNWSEADAAELLKKKQKTAPAKSLIVEVLVGGDRDVVEDVLELNDDYLGTNCTRRDTFNSHLMESAGRMVNGDD